MAQIAIMGCGWLGLPLAIKLQQSGHNIVATCRSKDKAKSLQLQGIDCQAWLLGDDLSQAQLTPLFESTILILNIPVGRKNPQPARFLENIQKLIEHASLGKIQHVLFISTTSVYGSVEGVITETTAPKPETESAKVNWQIENLVRQNFGKNCNVIRPAGLVGIDRHPVRFLAGKQGLSDPSHKINLIHQVDVVSAIEQMINKEIWGETLHLSATEHPSKQDYYHWAAEQLNLPLPTFAIQDNHQRGKIIDSSHSLTTLGLALSYPSPFDMLT